MATIADQKLAALLELGNRSDIDTGVPSRLDVWYRSSYVELGMNVPLETLEASVPAQFTQGQDTYALPANGRFPKCITMNSVAGTDFSPGSDALSVIVLDYKDITTIRQMSSTASGPPSYFCMYGGKAIIRPVPDDTYFMIWDLWVKPTIAPVISATILQVPDDWLEIVDMGALMRGFKALLERDKARELQELLYGFKTPTGKQVPGYITYRQTQDQAGAPWENYGLAPRVRRYTG